MVKIGGGEGSKKEEEAILNFTGIEAGYPQPN
jgi:hypothetical protein